MDRYTDIPSFKTPVLSQTHEARQGYQTFHNHTGTLTEVEQGTFDVTTEVAVGEDDFIYRRFTWVRTDTKNKKKIKPQVFGWRRDEPLTLKKVTLRGGKRFEKITRSTVEEFLAEHKDWVTA
jgi:hypothetical protein